VDIHYVPAELCRIEEELDGFRREDMHIDLGYKKVEDSPFSGQQVED